MEKEPTQRYLGREVRRVRDSLEERENGGQGKSSSQETSEEDPVGMENVRDLNPSRTGCEKIKDEVRHILPYSIFPPYPFTSHPSLPLRSHPHVCVSYTSSSFSGETPCKDPSLPYTPKEWVETTSTPTTTHHRLSTSRKNRRTLSRDPEVI